MYTLIKLRGIISQKNKYHENKSNHQRRKKNLVELSDFVVNTNFCRHTSEAQEDKIALSSTIVKEDIDCFEHSQFFIVRDLNDKIVGSIKTTKWDNKKVLPIQRLFNINIREVLNIKDTTSIWHVGRLAIKKSENTLSVMLLKKLMVQAIYPVCAESKSILVAECDLKLFKTLKKMGIRARALGPTIKYLNSETVPMYVKKSGLLNFLKTNIHLYESTNI